MVMLPDGWELDEDGNPRPRRKKYRLSDLVIDEVSCVKSGANQRAHIVLVKSDDGQPDPDRVVLFKSDLNRFILEHEMPEDALPLYSPPNRYPDAKRVGAFYESHPASYERRLGRYPVSGFAKGDDMTEDPTGPVPDPYGPAETRYADAAMIAKHYRENPREYDRRHAPKVEPVEKSNMALVLSALGTARDPAAIAKMLDRDPGLYDAILAGDA